MQQIFQDCIDDPNMDTLQELLLRFPFLLQFKHILTPHEFTTLARHIKYELVVRKESLALQPGFLYFFLDKGAIFRRQCNGKTQHTIKAKERTWVSTSSRINKPNDSKQQPKAVIKQYDSYESPSSMTKYLQDLYFSNNSKYSTVLTLNQTTLPPKISQRLKETMTSKLKLIGECEQMREVQKVALSEKIHKFEYLQLQFGQTLYSKGTRHQSVFFIKSGIVQIISARKTTGEYLVNPRSCLGILKSQHQWARCASQKVQCYSINIQQLFLFFPALRQVKLNKNRNNYQLTAATTPQYWGQEGGMYSVPLRNEVLKQSKGRGNSSRRRYNHQSLQNIGVVKKKQQKRTALRQHFSNYYNEVFDEFSQKKMRYMRTDYTNQQNLNLYKIKLLQRKAPVMQDLKQRLKKLRMRKIKDCKQKLQKKVHIHSLSGLGVTVLQQQL